MDRCRREIAAIQDYLNMGGTDWEALLGLADWSAELWVLGRGRERRRC
jgi:hypothetical protein